MGITDRHDNKMITTDIATPRARPRKRSPVPQETIESERPKPTVEI